jgi:hypothetical protein
VIWESSYWKEDLRRLAEKLKARKIQKKFPERSLACLEKEIFIGCYIIRKLIGAKKLSDSIVRLKFPVRSHSSIGRKLTWFTWNRDFDRSYDFKNVHAEYISLPYLCNQLIHSFVFVPHFGRHGWTENTGGTPRVGLLTRHWVRSVRTLGSRGRGPR